jgi:tetratricopeptide (TPR) repeat protein
MASVSELYNEHEKLKDQGRYEEAIAKLEECLKSDERHVLSHLGLAVLLGKVGRHEEAIEHSKRACELEPNEAFNFTALSVTYQRAYAGTQNYQYISMAEDAMAKAHMLQGR